MLAGMCLGGAMMLRDTWRARAPAEVVSLGVSAAVQAILFLLLLKVKTFNYMIAIWPLGALMIAWVAIRLWDETGRLTRALMITLAVLAMLEAGSRIGHAGALATSITPYDSYEQRIAGCIPPRSRVLGFQHYWLGLRQFPYRSWLLPLNEANPDFAADPLPFDQAIDRVQPDVLLLDRYFIDLLRETQDPASHYHHIATGFAAFAARHRLEPSCTVVDATYGDMQVLVNRGGR
jgi:hypothetical protein